MAYSFYGGEKGVSFDIVERYDSISDMLTAFAQGGNYNDVGYGEYVIIDTANKSSYQNGCLYKRGFNYNDPAKEEPGEDADEEVKRAFIMNPGCGAEYKGRIVGPMGKSAEMRMVDWETYEEESGAAGETGAVNVVPGYHQGSYNDKGRFGYCNFYDSEGNPQEVIFAFKFPYTVFDIQGKSGRTIGPEIKEVSRPWPGIDDGIYYKEGNKYYLFDSVKNDYVERIPWTAEKDTEGVYHYSGLFKELNEDDTTHPFYRHFEVIIPEALSVKSFHWTDDFKLAVTLSDNTVQVIDDGYDMEYIHQLYMENEGDIDQKKVLKAVYVVGKDNQGNLVTQTKTVSTVGFNDVEAIRVDDNRNLIVLYSDPDKRDTIPAARRIVAEYEGKSYSWLNLGKVRDISSITRNNDFNLVVNYSDGTEDIIETHDNMRYVKKIEITNDGDFTKRKDIVATYVTGLDDNDEEITVSENINSVPLNTVAAATLQGDCLLILYSDPSVRAAIPAANKATAEYKGVIYNDWLNLGAILKGEHIFGHFSSLAQLKQEYPNGFGTDPTEENFKGWIAIVDEEDEEGSLITSKYAFDYFSTLDWFRFQIGGGGGTISDPRNSLIVATDDGSGRPSEGSDLIQEYGVWFILEGE